MEGSQQKDGAAEDSNNGRSGEEGEVLSREEESLNNSVGLNRYQGVCNCGWFVFC